MSTQARWRTALVATAAVAHEAVVEFFSLGGTPAIPGLDEDDLLVFVAVQRRPATGLYGIGEDANASVTAAASGVSCICAPGCAVAPSARSG